MRISTRVLPDKKVWTPNGKSHHSDGIGMDWNRIYTMNEMAWFGMSHMVLALHRPVTHILLASTAGCKPYE